MAGSIKSAVDEALSRDKDEVIVVLSSKDPSPIRKRKLVLTRNVPVFSIGRSSQVHSKGFVPADDNAWFDNPVMSRQHAEIMARFDETPTSVYINDAGSFHGTFHTSNDGRNQEQRVAKDKPVRIANGDTLRFGTTIFRSNKTYPPSSVTFNVEAKPQPLNDIPRRGFTVPDYIDDEDDENGEDETDLTITSVQSRLVRPSNDFKNTIDLTADNRRFSPPFIELPNCSDIKHTGSSVIDLTSEQESDSDIEFLSELNAGVDAHSPIAVSLERNLSAQPRMNINHASDGKMIAPFSPAVSSDEEDMDTNSDIMSDEDTESELGQFSEAESDASLGSGGRNTPPQFGAERGEYDNVDQESDDCNSSISGRSVNTHLESDGLFCSDEEDIEDEPVSTMADPELANYELGSIPTPSAFGFQWDITLAGPQRDPSPSDAALFKRRPLLDNVPNDSRAQKLGERSGKFEFFAARERNRLVVGRHCSETSPLGTAGMPVDFEPFNIKESTVTSAPDGSPNGSSGISFTPTTTTATVTDNPPLRSPEPPEMASLELSETNPDQYSAWADSGLQFINSPSCEGAQSSSFDLPRPTELNMESAFKFQQAKLSQLATNVGIRVNPQTRRLHIQDLLAQEPRQPYQPPPGGLDAVSVGAASTAKKRPHEEAFNSAEDSTTAECANGTAVTVSPQVIDIKMTDQDQPSEDELDIATASDHTAVVGAAKVEKQAAPTYELAPMPTQPDIYRPAKKVRIATVAAQVVACVALGSAATFTYLVNTAPVF